MKFFLLNIIFFALSACSPNAFAYSDANGQHFSDSSHLKMVDSKMTTYVIEIEWFLIYNTNEHKFNAYQTDYFNVNTIKAIMDNYDIMELDKAQEKFPNWNLTPENYGF